MTDLRCQKRWALGAAAAVSLLSAAGVAFGQLKAEDANPRPTRFLERRIFEGQFLETYIAQVMVPFREAAGPGGLDADEVANSRRRRDAQERAQNIAQVLRYDLNGDLVVTPDELAASRRPGETRGVPADELERFDVDGDGRVTLKEVVEASARISRVNRARGFDDLSDMLRLPQVRDGRLTAAGLQEAARQVFAQADLNGDGWISHEENQRFRASLPPEPAQTAISDIYCPMPAAEAGDLIVLLGSYEGGREPGSPHPTGTATIHIEPGRQPIYLIMPSYQAIRWTLTGAVGRVRHVVLSSYGRDDDAMPRGVDGVPGSLVKMFKSQGCVPGFSRLGGAEAVAADAAVALRLGRRADVIDAAYHATTFNVPPAPVPEKAPAR